MTKKAWLCASFILWSQLSAASIQSGANALITKLDPNAFVGVEVTDLTTGETLYSRLAKTPFIPASNMKLFSDAAALLALGPDYRFQNQLSTNASSIQQGTLSGELTLSLSGDPSFSHQRLNRLLKALNTWQIKKIHGDIVVDSTHASVTPSAPGWAAKDLAYSYGAPLGPVMVDANRLTVTVNPGARVGMPALIETNDTSETIEVVNEVKTQAMNSHCDVHFRLDAEHRLYVTGCMAKGQWAVQHAMALKNPMLHLEGLIKKQLLAQGITLDGEIKLGQASEGALLLAQERSKPVTQLIADTLKSSDNLYADSLFLHAAAVLNGAPVNWDKAQTVIKDFLQKQTNIDLKGAVMVDGSGLSRFDRITPAQTAALLQFLYNKFPLTYEYIAALPVSGRDGTLKRRLKKPSQQDFIRAKTGTMTGVNSLSGYLYTLNGHTLAFAIYTNRKPNSHPRVSGRTLSDRLCNYLLKQQPPNLSWAKFFSAHKRLSFQDHLTQAEQQRRHELKWRRLERKVKAALGHQPVSVVYRRNEMLIFDDQENPNRVCQALQKVPKQYPFALALASKTPVQLDSNYPAVLQMDSEVIIRNHQRVWVVKAPVMKTTAPPPPQTNKT